jgi:hypothetical protein
LSKTQNLKEALNLAKKLANSPEENKTEKKDSKFNKTPLFELTVRILLL